MDRDGRSGQSAAGAARRDGDLVFRRDLHDGRDLFRVVHADDDVRHVAEELPRLVVGVVLHRVPVVRDDVPRSGGAAEFRDDLGRHLSVFPRHRASPPFLPHPPGHMSMSLGTISIAFPMIPRSATRKMGASGSVLIAMTVSAADIPARCCTAPEMPHAM
ncbi:hypothetical protein SDC9_198883 [bioreactor metagenome]|uniref:Uncharacterized protein n=1 Tax=bioreactor metagenome TaxID=1076179 RepID=A0A645IIY0_9ZZZZ